MKAGVWEYWVGGTLGKADNRVKTRDEQDFRLLYRRFIRLLPWLLVLVCLVAGLFLLLGEKTKGFGILFLLAAVWLILDNPLENFAIQGVYTSSSADSQEHEGEEVLVDFSQREAVVLGPTDTLDLHTFSPEDVPSLLEEFIHEAQKAGIYRVKIIHGKGSGTLRLRVRALLARDRRVLGFHDASRESGGWGATVVELKPGREPEKEADD